MMTLAAGLAMMCGTQVANAANLDLQHYGQVGWWEITYDPEYNTCGMRADYNNGMSMAVLFDKTHEVGIMFWNRNWEGRIKPGARYTMSLDFNNGAWGYTSKNFMGGQGQYGTFIFLPSLKWEFVRSFMQANNLILSSYDVRLGSYSLVGSFNAAVEMAACQEQADYRRSGQRGSNSRGNFNM